MSSDKSHYTQLVGLHLITTKSSENRIAPNTDLKSSSLEHSFKYYTKLLSAVFYLFAVWTEYRVRLAGKFYF